jgi:methylamine dehydrogenase accessory protein MauD
VWPEVETFWTLGIVALGVANGLTLIALLAFARELGTVLVRLGPAVPRVLNEGPSTGTRVQELEVRGIRGDVHTIGATEGKWKVLMFVAPACPSCVEVAPALKTFASQYRDRARVYAISSGAPSPSDFDYASALGPGVVFARDARVAADLHIPGTPYALLLDENNVVVSLGVTNNLEQLEALFAVQLRQVGFQSDTSGELAMVEARK